MLECQILGLSQEMNFTANISQTFVVLRLPNGQQVRAAVYEQGAQSIVELQVAARGIPRVQVGATAPEGAFTASESDSDYDTPSVSELTETANGVKEFGGQYNGGVEDTSDYSDPPAQDEELDSAALPLIEDPDPEPVTRSKDKSPKRSARMEAQQAQEAAKRGAHAPPKNLFKTATGKLVAPSKTVPRNEAGYPMVPSNGGVDAEELTGTRDQDEDGVGSI